MSYEDYIVGGIGAAVGLIATNLLGVTWQTFSDSVTHLVWVGFIAFFSGIMSVLGKKAIEKFMDKMKRKKEPK